MLRNCSQENEYIRELDEFCSALVSRGYVEEHLKQWIRYEYQQRNFLLLEKSRSSREPQELIRIPNQGFREILVDFTRSLLDSLSTQGYGEIAKTFSIVITRGWNITDICHRSNAILSRESGHENQASSLENAVEEQGNKTPS